MDSMWVEKYRPTKLSNIVGQKGAINSIQGLLENVAQMPHLLFSGSAGIGKTTTALCIAQQILGENRSNYTLELNASDERGIDMVREKVKRFSRYAGMGEIPFKIIILDEADEMTSGAQTALRRIIEDTAKYCRFIIIANNVSKIIDPIQSRCANFRFTSISKEEMMGRLRQIAETEGVSINDESLDIIHDYSGGDMRHSINLMQASVTDSSVTADSVRTMAGLAKVTDVERILQMAMDGKFTEARQKTVELIKIYGMSESDFLKYITAAAFKLERTDPARIVRIIAEYDYRILSGANSEIQLSAMLSEMASNQSI